MKEQILAYMKGLPLTVYLVVGVIAAAGGWLALNNAHQRALGAERILTAQVRADWKAAKRQVDSLTKAYRVDTLRLTKYRLKTDSLTTTVELWKHDTLKVVEYVAKMDTTVKACVQALQTCDQLQGAQRRRAEAAETDAKLLRRQMPSALAPWRHRAEGAIVAGAVVWLAGRIK